MTVLRPLLFPVLGLVAILLAAVGQYLHTYYRQWDILAASCLLLAAGLWIATLATHRLDIETRASQTAEPPVPPAWPTRTLVLSALALTALTFLFSGGNEFNGDNVLAWLLSIAVFVYAFWQREKSGPEWRGWLTAKLDSAQRVFADGWNISPHVLLLAGVLLLGVFFYYYNLDGVPAEMDSDHAEKLLDVNDIVTGGLRPIFFERNTGREPLQFYLTAAEVNLTGHPIDHMALKLITAALGVMVIPFTFLMARELFDDDVALLAALFIAFSKWPVTIARMGLRFPLTPVFIAPLLYFLFRALKYHRRNDFLMAGLFLGVGLYGYNAFRIAPLLILASLVLWVVIVRRPVQAQTRPFIVNSLLLFAFAGVILMPLGRYMIENPGNVWYRVATRLSDAEHPLTDSPVAVLGGNLINAALMFNWTGDEAWPNSIPKDPTLDYVSGALFLLGACYAVYRLGRYREPVYAFVLMSIGIMLLPSALSIAFPNENPSVVRAGGAIPFVFILVALPLAWLSRAFRRALAGDKWNWSAGALVIAMLLLVSLRANFLRYFRDFDGTYRQASWNSSEVAAAIRGFADSVGDLDHAWILLYPHWIDTRNVAINMHAIGWEQTLPSGNDAASSDDANKLYVLNLDDDLNLAQLEQLFPNGQRRIFHSRTPEHDFLLYYVPGTLSPHEPLGK